MNIGFKVMEGGELPKYESEMAIGLDIKATKILKVYKGTSEITGDKLERIQKGFVDRGYIMLRAFERILFGTSLMVELPEELELQVRPRSGTVLKKGITVLNSPGTIDPDYKGEIGIIAYNSTPFLAKVEINERIAQLVPAEKVECDIHEIEVLSESNRGDSGFGSTGI